TQSWSAATSYAICACWPSPGSSKGVPPSQGKRSSTARSAATPPASQVCPAGVTRRGVVTGSEGARNLRRGIRGKGSQRGADRVQDLLLHPVVGGGQFLLLVHPENSFLLPHAMLDGDGRVAARDALEHDAQAMLGAARVDAEVLALEAPRVRAHPSRLLVLL